MAEARRVARGVLHFGEQTGGWRTPAEIGPSAALTRNLIWVMPA